MSSKGKKSKSRNKGDLFGAMMADSDSDSDEEEGTDSHTSSAPSSKSTTTDANNSNEAKDMKKKSKKKKKKKRGGNHQNDDDAFLDEAVAANNVASEKEKKTDDVESSNAVSFIVSTIMEVIIPFILTILMWLGLTIFININSRYMIASSWLPLPPCGACGLARKFHKIFSLQIFATITNL